MLRSSRLSHLFRHSRLARHRNRSRHRRYGRFRSCGGVPVPGFLKGSRSSRNHVDQASCRGDGLSVERPGVGGATQHGRRCWRTTRLSPADFAGCRSGLKNWRSAASDQMITVNLPATTRNYMPLTPLTPLTPLYLSFSGIAARRMPSARCTLTPCSFCTWESKEVAVLQY